MRPFYYLLFSLLFIASCVSAPEFPIEPILTFERVNKDQIRALGVGLVDSIEIQFSFTDGDGDISQPNGDSIDIFLTDSRVNIPQSFSIPMIPVEGTGNGISGDIFITVVNTTGICCIIDGELCPQNPRLPVDTFSYAIQIRDRAGNMSNRIQTSPVNILCREQ